MSDLIQNSDLPARRFFAITPHNTNDLPGVVRGLILAVGGVVVVLDEGDNEHTLTLPAGLAPIIVKRVKATGTTATGITGLI
jgi:hypothetical protein